jgi:hypothetical protein
MLIETTFEVVAELTIVGEMGVYPAPPPPPPQLAKHVIIEITFEVVAESLC